MDELPGEPEKQTAEEREELKKKQNWQQPRKQNIKKNPQGGTKKQKNRGNSSMGEKEV